MDDGLDMTKLLQFGLGLSLDAMHTEGIMKKRVR